MPKPKTFYEYVNELHPPKFKVWITPKVRLEAAKALGLSRKPEAAEPLVMAMADKDKALRDAAAEALSHLEDFPSDQKAPAAKALLNFIRDRENDFIADYFNRDKNPELMALVPEQKGHPILAEPESYLAGAVSMIRQLDKEKAEAVEKAQAEGLDAYSRRKFRANVRLLSRLAVFPLSPAQEALDTLISKAEATLAQLTGKKPEALEAVVKPASAKSETDIPPLSAEALAEFVEKGLERRHVVTVALSEAPRLLYAVAAKIEADNPHVDRPSAARMAAGGIALECLHCGPLQKAHVKKFLDAAAEGYIAGTQLEKLALDRSNAGVLATGRCPGCDDRPVKAALDRNWFLIPEKPAASTTPPPEAAPAASSFNVVYAGEILPGHDPAAVREKLAALFKTDAARVEVFFTGAPRPVKKGLDQASAEKLREGLAKIGAKAAIEPAG